MSDAAAKMRKARCELVLERPFFAHLALRLKMRPDPTCRTAWSDGRVLAYNPQYIDALSLEKVKGLQCHEVLHLACRHHTRRDGRDPVLWNKACDLAINPILLEVGVELPSGFLDDPAHHGKSADAIYAVLLDRPEEPNGGAENGPEQEIDADNEAEMDAAGENAGEAQAQRESSDSGNDSAAAEAAGEAAGGDGEEGQTEETAESDPGLSGEVRDAPEASRQDGGAALQTHDDAWKTAASQALHKAMEAGELPGSLQRLLLEQHAPALCWRDVLRRFLSEVAHNDFNWMRPNRRYIHAGLHLPGLENQELAEVAVAVDVSGSVTQPELDAFAAELTAVLEEFDTAITVFTCDAAVTTQERLARWDLPLDFNATGGGGTDFRPPFKRLEEEGAQPACLIYFTDMACPHYPQQPDFPVLWVTSSPTCDPPPFGEVIHMEPA